MLLRRVVTDHYANENWAQTYEFNSFSMIFVLPQDIWEPGFSFSFHPE